MNELIKRIRDLKKIDVLEHPTAAIRLSEMFHNLEIFDAIIESYDINPKIKEKIKSKLNDAREELKW